MRFDTPAALLLLATVTSAFPAPQDDPSPTVTSAATTTLPTAASTDVAVASDQLEDLAAFAQNITNSTLDGNTKRGGCGLWNLSIRKEWCVNQFSYVHIIRMSFRVHIEHVRQFKD